MTSTRPLPYGWNDFDQVIVGDIHANRDIAVNRAANGGIVCPFLRHRGNVRSSSSLSSGCTWIPWGAEGYKKGTSLHGEPPVTFRISPTYIYDSPMNNFIVGHSLVNEAVTGKWGKAEVGRLGHENSEDALSWNVFRSLQEADALSMAVAMLSGLVVREKEIELYCWGRKIRRNGSEPWPEFQKLRDRIEPGLSIQTEPDICLHVPGLVWIFIEAKFSSPTTTIR